MLQHQYRSIKQVMERESAFEDIGYKAEPVRNTRPLIDQGSHDYLVIWPTEWKLLKV